jgi:hypothetical protein
LELRGDDGASAAEREARDEGGRVSVAPCAHSDDRTSVGNVGAHAALRQGEWQALHSAASAVHLLPQFHSVATLACSDDASARARRARNKTATAFSWRWREVGLTNGAHGRANACQRHHTLSRTRAHSS